MSDPVVVIGATLAGMAAAARLAKAGHAVEVWEAGSVLGGRWAPYALDQPRSDRPVLVDDAPAVLNFPAPWRDLFRKSGRPLEAELARAGYQLIPAEPIRLVFADGSRLTLPTDRGEQFAALSRAYGAGAAGRWRDLLDRLDDVWQTLRPLGLERELDPTLLSPAVRQRLLQRRTVADLATSVDQPQLAALIRSVAYRQGSTPDRTPALAAVDLSVARTFGAWTLTPTAPGPGFDTGRSSVLVEALAARLRLRKVEVRLDTAATQVVVRGGRVVGVRSAAEERPVAAVISTVSPRTSAGLLPRSPLRSRWRPVSRRPALAPTVTHTLDRRVDAVSETVVLTSDGVPVVTYRRPAGEHSVRSVHDFTQPRPDPSFGLEWRGFRSWVQRPPISEPSAGLFTAGPFSPAGLQPSQVILSGALASYACHDMLSGTSGE